MSTQESSQVMKTDKPLDARAMRSRQALRAALLKLVEQKSFEQISIRDITTTAGVSYPVFFRQFNSKEDLLGDIATVEIRELLRLPLIDSSHESSIAICRFVQNHRALWKTLLTGGATSIMRAEFIRIAKEIVNPQRLNPNLPVDVAAAVTVSGLFEVLAWWLNQSDDYPVEHVSNILETLVLAVNHSKPLSLL